MIFSFIAENVCWFGITIIETLTIRHVDVQKVVTLYYLLQFSAGLGGRGEYIGHMPRMR